MTDPWVCIDCGARQAAGGACAACGNDPTLDLRDMRTREFMRDVELRLSLRREGRIRIVGVLAAMLFVGSLWFIPGYWSLRGTLYPGLPFFSDQWIAMALLGYGLTKVLEKVLAKRRFPYLRADDLSIIGAEPAGELPAVSDFGARDKA